MGVQERIIRFVTRANWVILALVAVLGPVYFPADVAVGMTCGGLIVTFNFYLLSRTLEKGLRPGRLSNWHMILAKYYVRFLISAVIIFLLISKHVVDPLGLILGLSVVVVSVTLATVCELMKLIFKEAV